jgi:hypothetical protein
MRRTRFLALAAGAALTLFLGACASVSVDGTGTRLDDIVSIPLGARERPSTPAEPRIRREDELRRELGVDQAPDGSWGRCFWRGWGEGC